jgi:hypothetical protein
MATIVVEKLPKDYEEQRMRMVQKCAYLIKIQNSPSELVVNSDQTSIHLVSTGGART